MDDTRWDTTPMSDLVKMIYCDWEGIDGSIVRTRWRHGFNSGSDNAKAVASALGACSLASDQALTQVQNVLDHAPSVPGSGPFQSCWDAATMRFICSDSTFCDIVCPAPRSDILLPDLETVDPLNVDVANFIVEVLNRLVRSASGDTAASFVRGWRWRATPSA